MNINEIINHPFKLSQSQGNVLLSPNKYLKILAGAGAGKTETMARKIVSLILINNVKPEEIIAFTFTNRAAQNLKYKVYNLISYYQKDDALLSELDALHIGTIHSYAKFLLDTYFDYDNYTLLNENQEIAFLINNSKELEIENFSNSKFRSIMAFSKSYNMVCNEMLDIESLKVPAEEFYDSFKSYNKLLKDNKLLTFSSMFNELFKELENNKDIFKSVKYLFVDEFQDINKAQYTLIKIISKYSGVITVGDKRQTIYQWRGSNESFFDEFEKDFNNLEVINLDSNYRSSSNIVTNANKFVKSFENSTYNDMVAIKEQNGKLLSGSFNNEDEESLEVVNAICQLKQNSDIEYNDIAILVRALRYAIPIINELRRRKMPYIVGGPSGLFNRNEIVAMALIFTWFTKNQEYTLGKNKLMNDELIEEALKLWTSITNIDTEMVRYNLSIIKSKIYLKNSYQNITELYQLILENLNVISLDYTNDEENLVLSNLGKFNVLLTDYETALKIHGKNHRFETMINGLSYYINIYAKSHYAENLETNNNINAVFISTVHQAKGLEWSVVFLPALSSRRFPNSNIGKKQEWCNIPREMFDIKRYEGTPEDEKKLFYVAITRPKEALICSYASDQSEFLDTLKLSHVNSFINNLNSIKSNTIKNEDNPTYDVTDLLRYNRCGYMYLLRNVYGFQPGIKEEIGYGKALHYCLKNIVKLVRDGMDINTAVATAVDNGFNLPFADNKTLFGLKRTAKIILTEFCNKYDYIIENTSATEFKVSYMMEDTIVNGKLDSIVEYNNKEIILDYKTDKDVGAKEEFNMQLNLYSLGIHQRKEISDYIIAYLTENEVEESEINLMTMDETKEKIRNIINNIKNKNYHSNSKYCKTCDVKKICRYYGELNGEQ